MTGHPGPDTPPPRGWRIEPGSRRHESARCDLAITSGGQSRRNAGRNANRSDVADFGVGGDELRAQLCPHGLHVEGFTLRNGNGYTEQLAIISTGPHLDELRLQGVLLGNELGDLRLEVTKRIDNGT